MKLHPNTVCPDPPPLKLFHGSGGGNIFLWQAGDLQSACYPFFSLHCQFPRLATPGLPLRLCFLAPANPPSVLQVVPALRSRPSFMVMGADVTHPTGAGRPAGEPSVTAITASHDPDLAQWASRVLLQEGGQEVRGGGGGC